MHALLAEYINRNTNDMFNLKKENFANKCPLNCIVKWQIKP